MIDGLSTRPLSPGVSGETPSSALIVDDVAINRKILKRKLRNFWGKECLVDEASSGEEALKLAERKDYQIIFMDQDMHNTFKPSDGKTQLQGDQTVRLIREKDQRIVIVMCTSSCNFESTTKYGDAGANALVPKAILKLKKFTAEILPEILKLRRRKGTKKRCSSRYATGPWSRRSLFSRPRWTELRSFTPNLVTRSLQPKVFMRRLPSLPLKRANTGDGSSSCWNRPPSNLQGLRKRLDESFAGACKTRFTREDVKSDMKTRSADTESSRRKLKGLTHQERRDSGSS